MQRARHAPELLDAETHDPAELAHSLAQVADVNRFLGGTRAAVRAVTTVIPRTGPVRILDVGCGSADVPLALAHELARRDRTARIVATDLHPQILSIARRHVSAHDSIAGRSVAGTITFARADAFDLPFRTAAFDIAMMSLTLHHFEDDEPVAVMRELARVAHTVIVNDLERGWPNYLGARALAVTAWSGNRLTRHDGPLSVRRAFTRPELIDLAQRAGLLDVQVRRRFFYRLVLTGRSAQAAAHATVA